MDLVYIRIIVSSLLIVVGLYTYLKNRNSPRSIVLSLLLLILAIVVYFHIPLLSYTVIILFVLTATFPRSQIERYTSLDAQDFITSINDLPLNSLFLDPEGTITVASSATTNLLSYRGEELIGIKFNTLVTGKNKPEFLIDDFLAGAKVKEISCTLKKKDKTFLPIQLSITPIRKVDTSQSGYLCILSNQPVALTELESLKKQLQERTKNLTQANLNLEKVIEEHKKTEFQLKQSMEKLRISERLKALGQLAGGVAHDFKNQLFGIAANARLIKGRSRDNEKVLGFADNIINATHHSSDLTKQLLAFARKGTYQCVAIAVPPMITNLITLLERTLDKKIRITSQILEPKATIIGDPSQIENALLNCAFNGRDAMPKGGELSFIVETVHLDESYCKKSDYDITPGDFIHIGIKDTGGGIEKENIGQIFEPFFTTKDFGHGLGLAAVYGTIKEHNGAITIQSELQQGTLISLYIPSSQVEVPKRERTRELDHLTHPVSLLVIEDEVVVRNATNNTLQELGFTVHTKSNGTEALTFYSENHSSINMVLLDMMLPDYDVEELFDALMSINSESHIILWSAHTAPNTIASLKQKGARAFIDKGTDIPQFKEIMLDLVEELEPKIHS